MNNLAIRNQNEWLIIREQAEILVKTGFLPQSIKTAEQAVAIIMTGAELGIGAMAALQTINVIQGKPTVSPQLMLALINRSGQLEDMKIEARADGATVTMKRRGRSAFTARFGATEAQSMGLLQKDNYKKQPATMYQWRAVAMAARAIFPDVILGLYTPEEMGAEVDTETGEIFSPEPATLQAEPLQLPPVIEETSPELMHLELDHMIIVVCDDLGQDSEWLTASVNKRFQVDDGLNSLGLEDKKKVLEGLLQKREQSETTPA